MFMKFVGAICSRKKKIKKRRRKLQFDLFAGLGCWNNNRTLIRRRRQDFDMTVEYTFNTLRRDDPIKFLIEVSNGNFYFSLGFFN